MKRDKLPVPPGFSRQKELFYGLLALGGSTLLSLWIFLARYFSARNQLFEHAFRTGRRLKTLSPGVQIEPFSQLMGGSYEPFILLLFCIPFWVLLHYASYRRGSMSIYLMRRLPDGGLLHRSCWTLPLLALAVVLLTLTLLFLLDILVYIYLTPAQCLPLFYRRLLP